MVRDPRKPSILLVHRDPVWVDLAKTRLELLGYQVAACPEPSWAVDLLVGGQTFDLLIISSETDPTTQEQILSETRKGEVQPKLMLLLDALDSSNLAVKRRDIITHRLTGDLGAFLMDVTQHLGLPQRAK